MPDLAQPLHLITSLSPRLLHPHLVTPCGPQAISKQGPSCELSHVCRPRLSWRWRSILKFWEGKATNSKLPSPRKIAGSSGRTLPRAGKTVGSRKGAGPRRNLGRPHSPIAVRAKPRTAGHDSRAPAGGAPRPPPAPGTRGGRLAGLASSPAPGLAGSRTEVGPQGGGRSRRGAEPRRRQDPRSLAY